MNKHVNLQVVLAGCEGQVHLYSITVDDTAQAGQRAILTALDVLSEGEALPALHASHTMQTLPAGVPETALTRLGSSIQQLADPGLGQHVLLQLVCQVRAFNIDGVAALMNTS